MLRCVSSRAPSRAAFCAVALSVTLGLAPGRASAQERVTAEHDAAATSTLTWVYEHAVALAARADIETAAELFEIYAEACLESATAELEPGAPCAHSAGALVRAFELRQTLGQLNAAALNAATFRRHFLYAEPRRAIQRGVRLARMYMERGLTASRHTVAERWTRRCARGLAELDPARHPMQAELHGGASLRPPPQALPSGLGE